MEKIDRSAAKILREEALRAVKEVADRHGIVVELGNGRYDPNIGTFDLKVKFALEGSERKDFERWATILGLDPEDFGKKFINGGKTFRISGIAPRSKTYPILATSGGKTYKFRVESVRAGLHRESLR